MSEELLSLKVGNLSIIADEFNTTSLGETLLKLREKSELWDMEKKYKLLAKLKVFDINVSNKVKANCTNWIKANLFSNLENLVDNDLKHILIIGWMGTGKTWLINWLIEQGYSIYPEDVKIAVIFSNSLQYNIDNLPKADVVFSIVDDAIELQSSAEYMKRRMRKLAGDWYNIRHIYERKHHYHKTLIINIMATQRWKSLNIDFRNPDLCFYKNILYDYDDNKELIRRITWEHFKNLAAVTILRNLNMPEYSAFFGMTNKFSGSHDLTKKYAYFSSFDPPLFRFKKKMIGIPEKTAALDLMNQITFLRLNFLERYGKPLYWKNIKAIVGWNRTHGALRKAWQEWRDKQVKKYVADFDKYSKEQVNLKKRIKPKNKGVA